jgi:flagellin-like protein
MLKLSEDKRGLSEVVSTLIMLVVAVLLAAIVTYYATNITMTRTTTEDARVSKYHIWVNSSGSMGAFKLQNLGGKDILIDKVVIRGVSCNWLDVAYYRVQELDDVTGDFVLTYNATSDVFNATIGGISTADWTYGGDSDIPMRSGETILFSVLNPTNIGLDDIGTPISITVFTNNAQWIIETNVESAS